MLRYPCLQTADKKHRAQRSSAAKTPTLTIRCGALSILIASKWWLQMRVATQSRQSRMVT
jgi:hypothetical protein